MRSVVNVTESADRYISSMLKDNKCLLVGYNNKGCSGHKYTFEMINDHEIGKHDEVVTLSSGKLVVSSSSLIGLLGSTLDLNEDQFEQKLVWKNPFAINQCGCGESFQLDSKKACE